MSSVSNNSDVDLTVEQLINCYDSQIQDLESRLVAARDLVSNYSNNQVSLLRDKYNLSQNLRSELSRLQGLVARLNAALDEDKKLNLSVRVKSFDSICEVITVKYFQASDAAAKKIGNSVNVGNVVPGGTNVPYNTNTPSHVKLPPIQVPVFNNSTKDFPGFFELFDAVYGLNNNSITSVQRLYYLRSLTTGEALSIVSRFPLTDGGYGEAVKALKKRFQCPRTLSSLLMQEILQFIPAKRATSESLDKFLKVHDENVSALKSMPDIPDLADFLLVCISLMHLDPLTRKLFEATLKPASFPQFSDLIAFCHKQLQTFEIIDAEKTYPVAQSVEKPKSVTQVARFLHGQETPATSLPTASSGRGSNTKHRKSTTGAKPSGPAAAATTSNRCLYCLSTQHNIFKCWSFNELNLENRKKWISDNSRCSKCLSSGHPANSCNSDRVCWYCKSPIHNSLICEKRTAPVLGMKVVGTRPDSAAAAAPSVSMLGTGPTSRDAAYTNSAYVSMLGTITAEVPDHAGFLHEVTCLLDTGSQKDLICLETAKKLGLGISDKTITSIMGLGCAVQNSVGEASLTIQSRFDPSVKIPITACVLPVIANDLPAVNVVPDFVKRLDKAHYADKYLFKKKRIDIVLSNNNSMYILGFGSQPAQHRPLYPESTALKHSTKLVHSVATSFGEILWGKVPIVSDVCQTSSLLSIQELNDQMERFFEKECIPDSAAETLFENPDDAYAEKHFVSTHSREPNGRFVVQLPFKPDAPDLGNNRSRATACFHKMEMKLSKSNELDTYLTALRDYADKGQIAISDSESPYLFNQHVVIKRSSGKAKLVFDPTLRAAGKSHNFNDTLFTGPQLLRQMNYILLSVRTYPVALAADIETFYRSINVDELSQSKMHILARLQSHHSVCDFEITHLPYGLNCSPFIALRVLRQLATDHAASHPKAADSILYNSYMDDYFLGCHSVEDCVSLRDELSSLLSLGQFKLGKFVSNKMDVVGNLPEELLGLSKVQFYDSTAIPVLGLLWCPLSDTFQFEIEMFPIAPEVTRRNCTSYLAKTYDSLGLLHPVIFWLKWFVQTIWHDHPDLGWDTSVPTSLSIQWLLFTKQMPILSNIKVPRYCSQPNSQHWLAVFSDASEKGYAFCSYLVSRSHSNLFESHLLFAKSKLAPKRVKRTIPQLELAALELASKGIKWFLEGNIVYNQFSGIHIFSDSEIALAYLKIPVHKLKVYTAHRVSNILELIKNSPAKCSWHHCSSAENPADFACRGQEPSMLVNNKLWFHGPLLLRENFPLELKSPGNISESQLTDIKKSAITLVTTITAASLDDESNPIVELIKRHSSYSKVNRIMGYVLRFIKSCTSKNVNKCIVDTSVPSLSAVELNRACTSLVKCQQSVSFASEIALLSKGKSVPRQLLSLTPFLDTQGVMRVGGRLSNSTLEFDARHPMLLPKDSALSTLICRYYHACTAHSGSTYSLALSRRKFWIVSGRSLMRSVVYNCVICAKLNPRLPAPVQGDLPGFRTRPTSTFAFKVDVGVDAFGPYQVKLTARKNSSTTKVWGLLFLCLQTRAVHIEPVSSMSTKAFLAAFDRFTARRGLCCRLHSDNAGSFVAGGKHLSECAEFLKNNSDAILSALASKGIEFSNIPPYTPWMAGWEPLVKLAKKALKPLLCSQNLYYEEYATLFARVEGILNSRPYLVPSADAIDPANLLCPGSFLVGGPLISPPDLTNTDIPPEKISDRYDRLRSIIKVFWSQWHRDVLNTLMQKLKWPKASGQNVAPGQMVWIRDRTDSVPNTWPIAVVEKTYPDPQGNVRVVDVRSTSGIHRRPVRKLVIIPVSHQPTM